MFKVKQKFEIDILKAINTLACVSSGSHRKQLTGRTFDDWTVHSGVARVTGTKR